MKNDENNLKKENKLVMVIKKVNMLPKLVKNIILIALVIGIAFLVLNKSSNFTTNTKTTKLGFKDVGLLVTQTAYLTIVEDNKDSQNIFDFKIPFTESRQIYSYDVQVDAAVDFEKISYKIRAEEIEIKLPHAKIYKTTVDNDSLEVYLDEANLFSRIDLEEQNDALKKMKKQAVADAEANGIIKKADDNAKKLIESLIKQNEEYQNKRIIYKYITE